MSLDKHEDFLHKHCRVCCKPLGRSTKYNCKKYPSILQVMEVNVSGDNEKIHPKYFCNSCYLTAKRASHSSRGCAVRPVTEWLPHSESYCQICDKMSKGGRPKKSTSSGRPSHFETHVRSVSCNLPYFLIP